MANETTNQTTEVLMLSWDNSVDQTVTCTDCPYYRKDGCLIGMDPDNSGSKTCPAPENIQIEGVKRLYVKKNRIQGTAENVVLAAEIRSLEA